MFRLFRKRINQNCLTAAVRATSGKLRGSVDAGSSIYDISLERIDQTIQQSPDAQLMTLAVLRPALSYALQDAYIDAGLASPLGPADVDLPQDDERRAIRDVISFLPRCRLNLDMRYRYMFVADVSSDVEDELWNRMVTAAQPIVLRSFERKTDLHPFWIGVLARLGDGDADGAWSALAEAN